uniref:Uncharacterized protein n=1 Tax=Attheya septentrionalis TaxID=420275 RepID=A0A7S2UPH2_9STRA|mmetsp:Transcript_5136/g.9014  ORF Transcript_5136/g.9014 Transcript_5136/m.9014 type:complete len:569 (+) Transcript_5136:3-1709(+)
MDDEVAAFASTKPRSSDDGNDDNEEWTDPNNTANAASWPVETNPGSAFVSTPTREQSHNANANANINANPHHKVVEDKASFPHSASPTWDGVVPRPTSETIRQDPSIRTSNNSINALQTPPRPPHGRGPPPPQPNHSTTTMTPIRKGTSSSIARSSPMARMRDTQVRSSMSLPPGSEIDPSLDAEGQQQEEPPAVAVAQETKQKISGDEFVADKHRKWRRKMLVAAEQEKAHLEGDGSVGSDRRRNRRNEAAVTITSSPFAFVQQMFSKNCLAYDTNTTSSQYADDEDGESYYSDDEDDDDGEEDDDDDSEETEEDEDYDRGRSPRSRHELYTNAADNAAQSSSSKYMSGKEVPPEIVLESFIKQISQIGVPLMWHKRVVNESAIISHPISVRAFLQLGAVDESTDVFKGPRLIWDKVESSKEKMGKASLPDGISNRSGNFDLLDIQSIDKAGIMDLKEYPFAIPGTSFFLNFSGGDPLLFETSSEFEQDRVVNGIRQLVARLSFELIMGNNKGISKKVISLQGINIPDSLNGVQDLLIAKAVSDITNELVEKTLQKCIPTDYYGRVV